MKILFEPSKNIIVSYCRIEKLEHYNVNVWRESVKIYGTWKCYCCCACTAKKNKYFVIHARNKLFPTTRNKIIIFSFYLLPKVFILKLYAYKKIIQVVSLLKCVYGRKKLNKKRIFFYLNQHERMCVRMKKE